MVIMCPFISQVCALVELLWGSWACPKLWYHIHIILWFQKLWCFKTTSNSVEIVSHLRLLKNHWIHIRLSKCSAENEIPPWTALGVECLTSFPYEFEVAHLQWHFISSQRYLLTAWNSWVNLGSWLGARVVVLDHNKEILNYILVDLKLKISCI